MRPANQGTILHWRLDVSEGCCVEMQAWGGVRKIRIFVDIIKVRPPTKRRFLGSVVEREGEFICRKMFNAQDMNPPCPIPGSIKLQ